MKKEKIKKMFENFQKKAKNYFAKLKEKTKNIKIIKKEPRVVMRKTYRKSSWKKIILPILGLIIIVAIIIGLFFLIKNRKKSEIHPLSENPKAISQNQEPGKVVEKDELDEALPSSPEVISQGGFNNVEQSVSGKALFIKSGQDIYLRLENFKTLNGQDMHVYLSPILNLDPNDAIDAGVLKATSGNMNYKLEKSIDLDKYSNVLIWSNRFSAFFGYAVLQKGELPPEISVEENNVSANVENENVQIPE